MNREEALNRYVEVTSKIKELQAEQKSLRAMIFAKELQPEGPPLRRIRATPMAKATRLGDFVKTIREYGQPMSFEDISSLTGLQKNTVYKYLQEAQRHGVVRKLKPGQYEATVHSDNEKGGE